MNRIFHGNHSIYFGAHRGASAYCPENTMTSFHKAIELGADLLELDVQLSKDDEVVVFHDFRLEKTSNGTGLLRDLTLTELKQLDTGSWFSVDFAEERIPTLEQVLDLSRGRIWLSIELKQQNSEDGPLARKVVELISSYGMEDQIQIMSFNHKLLTDVRKHTRSVRVSPICPARLDDPIGYLRSIDAQILNTPWNFLSEETVAQLHQAGFLVYGSMSDDPDVMKRLLHWKVDAMDTNVPDLMMRLREEADLQRVDSFDWKKVTT
jgi:glycerophosphoryl diester phosphodiesterase